MKRPMVLITGSEGLIGRILLEKLPPFFKVIGLDKNCSIGKNRYRADVFSFQELDSVFAMIGPVDCIVHLAADSRVDAAWESVLRSNIAGTRNIYECAKRHGVKKVIFASSSHVTGAYGKSRKITTQDPVRPDGDYGASKAFGEIMARQYFDLHGINSICLRIGWVIKDDDPTFSEEALHMWLSHRDLVQLIKKSILAGKRFGIYYGLSKNRITFWDISNAEEEIGYEPRDDSYSLIKSPVTGTGMADKIRKKIQSFLQ